MGTTGMKYSLAYNSNWELFFCYFPQMYEGNQAKKSSYFEGSSNFWDLFLRYQEYLQCIETLGPKYLKLRSQKLTLYLTNIWHKN